jgi:alpha-tubulin suppressor-like RCC1 family protein
LPQLRSYKFMINSQNLIDKICALISAGGLSSLQSCQTTGALDILSNPVVSVASFADLPNAITYAGRLIYVSDENRYYHAVDGYWLNNLSSKVFKYASEIQAWGGNPCGVLGTNSIVSLSSPVSIVGGFTDWCNVSAGRCHSLGVRQNGTAWAWGNGAEGRLGDNTVTNKSSPVSVVGGFTDWCQVSGGFYHSLGVRCNGSAWAWGAAVFGILGDNTTVSKSSPVSVVGGFTDWCQISASSSHSLGVRQNGTAWAWGRALYGRLGDNTAVDKSSPVSVVGDFTDWCQLSAGHQHSLGVRQNGTAWAWGRNSAGTLGSNNIVSRSSPVSVVGGFTDWCQVSAGYNHSLAVRQNGTAWAWGYNTCSKLGDNTLVSSSKSSPVSVVGGFTDWCQVSAGHQHSLGVRQNGTAWAWGAGAFGRLGENATANHCSPVSVVGGLTGWCQAAAGGCHSLAINQTQKGF